jgi:VWFA-related protein
MMRVRGDGRGLWVAAVAMSFALVARQSAQGQDQPFTLSVNAQVVTVPVTVRDSKNKLLQDLAKEDFTLTEDGQAQRIRYLTIDRDRPLLMGLLIDTSGSQKDYIKKERAAANVFFSTMMTRPEDTAFLVRFGNAIKMLQKPTASKDELRAALEHLEDPMDWRMDHPGGTLLYDALDLTCERITRDAPGRSAVIILSDGSDDGSILTLDQTIAAAQVSNTVIYSILYTDNATGLLGSPQAQRGKQVLEQLATATGGHLYQVSTREPLEKIFGDIAEEMRMQYVLAYSPTKRSGNSEFRKIELTGKDKSWKIQTRAGYYYTAPDGN